MCIRDSINAEYGENISFAMGCVASSTQPSPEPSPVNGSTNPSRWIEPLFGNSLQRQAEQVPSADALRGRKYVGLYLSASWCPPCRKFTPQLAEWYRGGGNKHIEIVFISSDRDEGAFAEYYANMPWAARPFDHVFCQQLTAKYKVSGIPQLVVLDSATGEIVFKDANATIDSADVQAAVTAWDAVESGVADNDPPEETQILDAHVVTEEEVVARDGSVKDREGVRDDSEFGSCYSGPVSYTHLRAHETPEHLVCRLLLEKKKQNTNDQKRYEFSIT
eukprot:TRINITY_DN47673_c0_g1_i1.p1 TRINITY_DN47673_c0_g1~~TRINITY_DN47673_c0_g1_i1.p1  ORF type:complete len:277 (-),score=57.94 TRINITY_DN47673_c0_g1_i1:36-866(-)